MKKLNLKWIFAMAIALPLLFLASCNTDDDGPVDKGDDFQPVLNENFSFTVDGNDVNFETTLTGNAWVTVNDVNHNFVDQKVTVNLPNMGEYTFTCSSLGSGNELTSDPFTITIDQDDLGFLNGGLWKSLSGGANQTKTWKIDMNADAELQFFAGPMYFSGYESEAAGRLPFWAWDVLPEELPYVVDGTEQTSFFNWEPDYETQSWIMAPGDYGTITFDGTAGTATTNIFGTEASGSFSFDTATWKMTLSGVTLPIDTARLNEPQYTDENLGLVRIFSLTDSAMQIGIKRSFEGFDDETGAQEVSEWTNVYNFIVDGYNYPEPEEFTYEEPVVTDVAVADLTGTWKFADVPGDWVGWRGIGDQGSTLDPIPLNGWADAAAMIGTDWFGVSQAQLDAAYTQEYVFGDDGSTSINGTATTYTIDAGVITFADSVTFALADHWYSVKVKSIKVLDVPNTDGIWVGNQNDGKNESQAFNLIKE